MRAQFKNPTHKKHRDKSGPSKKENDYKPAYNYYKREPNDYITCVLTEQSTIPITISK